MKRFINYSFFISMLSVLVSCSSSSNNEDVYYPYEETDKITGYYIKGTRTISIEGNSVEGETDKPYTAIVSKDRNRPKVLNVFLGINASGDAQYDVLDGDIQLSNFRTKDYGKILYDINPKPNLRIASLKGDDIPSYITNHFKGVYKVTEIKNVVLNSPEGSYFDASRNELSFESNGTFGIVTESGASSTNNLKISIKYVLRK